MATLRATVDAAGVDDGRWPHGERVESKQPRKGASHFWREAGVRPRLTGVEILEKRLRTKVDPVEANAEVEVGAA